MGPWMGCPMVYPARHLKFIVFVRYQYLSLKSHEEDKWLKIAPIPAETPAPSGPLIIPPTTAQPTAHDTILNQLVSQ